MPKKIYEIDHRHLSNIDCLTACTTCLVCLISTVNGSNKKKKKPIKTGTSNGHITNLKQSILETFYIYGLTPGKLYNYVIFNFFLCCLVNVSSS
jgi:hypothetical protein